MAPHLVSDRDVTLLLHLLGGVQVLLKDDRVPLDSAWTLSKLVMEPGDLESARSAYDILDDIIRRLHVAPEADWAGWPYPPFPTPWLEHWTSQSFSAMAEILRRAGAPDPDSSADDELTQYEPELAGFRFAAAVHACIRKLMGPELRGPILEPTPVPIEGVLESMLTKAAIELLELITDPKPETFEDPSTEPRWALAEISPDGQFTGRIIHGLADKLTVTLTSRGASGDEPLAADYIEGPDIANGGGPDPNCPSA